jgi:hypothetical protein
VKSNLAALILAYSAQRAESFLAPLKHCIPELGKALTWKLTAWAHCCSASRALELSVLAHVASQSAPAASNIPATAMSTQHWASEICQQKLVRSGAIAADLRAQTTEIP